MLRFAWPRRFRIQLLFTLATVAGALVFGTVGMMITEHLGPGDALFQTLITVTTLGFSYLPPPATTAGRIVLSTTLVVGVVALFGAAVTVLTEILERAVSRTHSRYVKMKGHYIVVGFGRIGRVVARELADGDHRIVVLDSDEALIEAADQEGWTAVEGDALDDEALQRAGVEDAKGIITTLKDDAHNVFVLVSARNLNPSIVAIATASSSETADKIRSVGADRVVPTELAAGQMLAKAAEAPLLVDLLVGSIAESKLTQMHLSSDSPLVGKRLAELKEEGHTVTILAYRKNGRFEAEPSPDLELEGGMDLLIHGRPKDMERFATAAGGRHVDQPSS